jgi:hypothetical protein
LNLKNETARVFPTDVCGIAFGGNRHTALFSFRGLMMARKNSALLYKIFKIPPVVDTEYMLLVSAELNHPPKSSAIQSHQSATMIPRLAKAGMQSGSIMCVADFVTQIVVEGRALDPQQHEEGATTTKSYDAHRTARWALAGLTIHGPYFFWGFSRVDGYFGAATSLRVVAYKTAVAQFILFPPYLVALFSYMGLMEGQDIIAKVQKRVPEAFIGGCVYWPVANGINFALVPATVRVPYLATSAGLWNMYLSWMNARGGK